MESRVVITGSIGGAAMDSVAVLTGVGQESIDPTLPAAKTGVLTTRSGNTSGELTLAAGHGIVDEQVVDVYWEGGLRRAMDVGTVAGNVVPISGGSGNNLPDEDSAILVGIRVVRQVSFGGSHLAAFGVAATGRCNVECVDNLDVIIAAREVSPSAPWIWWPQLGANPLAGITMAEVHCSTAELAPKQVRAGFLFSETPNI